jgi:flavin-dependent dehydrogenase
MVNVGLCGPLTMAKRGYLLQQLKQWLSSLRWVNVSIKTPAMGGVLAMDFGMVPMCSERVLFAGDTIGLVNPFTGEGISNALESGEIAAAEAFRVLESGSPNPNHKPYTTMLQQKYSEEWVSAHVLRKLFAQQANVDSFMKSIEENASFSKSFVDTMIGNQAVKTLLSHPGAALWLGKSRL